MKFSVALALAASALAAPMLDNSADSSKLDTHAHAIAESHDHNGLQTHQHCICGGFGGGGGYSYPQYSYPQYSYPQYSYPQYSYPQPAPQPQYASGGYQPYVLVSSC